MKDRRDRNLSHGCTVELVSLENHVTPYSMTFRLMSPYLETKERRSLFYLDKCNKLHFAKLAKLEVKSSSNITTILIVGKTFLDIIF